jgi:hydrogenase maturation protease
MTSKAEDAVLLIGYGSTLRGDDAIGRLVVERLADSAPPGVVVISTTQLVPELAAQIAEASAVIFVDAHVTAATNEIEVEEIAPLVNPLESTHVTRPHELLALTSECYGFVPPAWMVTVPVASLELTSCLSPKALNNLMPAVQAVERLINRLQEGQPAHA